MNFISNILRITGLRPASRLERRLNRRVRQYWDSIRRGRVYVPVEDFDPQAVKDCPAHGFMLAIGGADVPIISEAGPVLLEEAGIEKLPMILDLVPASSLLGQFGRRWEQVPATGEPVTAEYEFTTDTHKVFCRGVLLPLSSDGSNIDRVYGAINWKSERIG